MRGWQKNCKKIAGSGLKKKLKKAGNWREHFVWCLVGFLAGPLYTEKRKRESAEVKQKTEKRGEREGESKGDQQSPPCIFFLFVSSVYFWFLECSMNIVTMSSMRFRNANLF